MSIRIVCRPLTRWPGELRNPGQRRRGPFSASWSQTQELLEREARIIGGRELVIQLAIADTEIRRDGWPYARAQTRHPGVTVVVPDTDHGRLSWSTDRYERWQHNVRAVALSMEALRAADRHGVMQGRQYAGFRELGSGDDTWTPTVEEAAHYLAGVSPGSDPDRVRQIVNSRDVANRCYRSAAKRMHPDAGGDPDTFRRLEQAKAVLDAWGR